MAATVAAQGLRAGRRRSALNQALHELRRPLQAVALAAGPRLAAPAVGEDAMELAAAALERLDREINGGPRAAGLGHGRGPLGWPAPAVGRWQARAQLADGSLELRWNAGQARRQRRSLRARPGARQPDRQRDRARRPDDRRRRAAARGRLRIAVVDSGRAARPRARRNSPAEVIARLAGRNRHGHGLAVVRRVAAAHGGRFALRRAEAGSLAVLELPLAEAEAGRAGA